MLYWIPLPFRFDSSNGCKNGYGNRIFLESDNQMVAGCGIPVGFSCFKLRLCDLWHNRFFIFKEEKGGDAYDLIAMMSEDKGGRKTNHSMPLWHVKVKFFFAVVACATQKGGKHGTQQAK